MKTITVLSALASFAATQTTLSPSSISIPTAEETSVIPESPPDALDLAGIRAIPDPVYTIIEGLSAQDIPYATATAIQSAIAEQSESPLSVFPAATSEAINAAGNDAVPTGTPARKRDVDHVLEQRAACDPQATIANVYNVDVSSYKNFKNDASIASVANAAATPLGYFQNFKNLQGASSAYGYLGYSILKTYDVEACAKKCTAKTGCLAFNVFFERDPVVEPGTGCTNPDAFANIKCTYWGGNLDADTATNTGQWRSKFQVGIAGSNGYTTTSYYTVPEWSDPLVLNNAAMNAPLRDCAGTWTYMGYKLFTSGPFDPRLCQAACDTQSAYNRQNPPSTGEIPICAAFGTYILTKTNSSGSYPQGQMCTMYTSGWDAQYAVNKAAYDDSIGAKYTYSYSFFYSKSDLQPICSADIAYLQSEGAEFCTSYNGYSAPVTTATTNEIQTVTSTVTTITPVGTTITAEKAKRGVSTPVSVATWPASKISAACSKVATGVSSVTVTQTSTTVAYATATASASSSSDNVSCLKVITPDVPVTGFVWTYTGRYGGSFLEAPASRVNILVAAELDSDNYLYAGPSKLSFAVQGYNYYGQWGYPTSRNMGLYDVSFDLSGSNAVAYVATPCTITDNRLVCSGTKNGLVWNEFRYSVNTPTSAGLVIAQSTVTGTRIELAPAYGAECSS